MTADIINAAFETAGGFFVLLSVVKTYREKKVRGVHWAMSTFFTVWGYWNLWYYPSLAQWWSAIGAGGVAAANTAWLFLLWRYRHN